ncbi:MAG: hypothetical protein QOH03_3536, partial [Kribbellaceae bacterium]|nr:hypothetical protein [Kribbellaceae bacterium]
ACDAGIIPVILGSDSQPLDVGREKRYVTDGLRFALNQRDKGCVICHAPPIYCDAHHVVSWADGGVTSLANLVLMCRVDHTSLHDGHWTITIVNNKVQVTRPSWADPPPRTGRRLGQPSTTSATADAPTATTPWPTSTTDDPAPAPAPADADPWACSTSAYSTDADAADANADTDPAARPGWHWSYVDNIGWICPDEAATVDPWGDNPTQAKPSTAGEKPSARPDTTNFDPWADSA